MPVLESMMLGTPVLSSNVSSIPEVAGDGALLVDPYSTNEIRDAIRAMDQDRNLLTGLESKGRARAQKFGMLKYEDNLRNFQTGARY